MSPPPMQHWKVLSKNVLTHDVFELKLERPAGCATFRAGQYMSIVIPGAGPGGRNLRRAYSIASPPECAELELCVKMVDSGPGTHYLNSLKADDEFQAQFPFGDFCLAHNQDLPTLFIGTGTGVAPLRAMVLAKEWRSKAPLGFLLGVRAEEDILYPELFPEMKMRAPTAAFAQGHPHVRICLSRPKGEWRGFRGRVTDYLRAMDWDFARSNYYLCGSGAMLAEVKDFLKHTKSVDKAQIHAEKYF